MSREITRMALRMEHGIAALLTMAYAVGAPDVAPIFPRPMEVAFSKFHSDFNDASRKLYVTGVSVADQVGLAPAPRYHAASAVSAPAAR